MMHRTSQGRERRNAQVLRSRPWLCALLSCPVPICLKPGSADSTRAKRIKQGGAKAVKQASGDGGVKTVPIDRFGLGKTAITPAKPEKSLKWGKPGDARKLARPKHSRGDGPAGEPVEGHEPDPSLTTHRVGPCAEEEAKS
jgi:hypothetical protein